MVTPKGKRILGIEIEKPLYARFNDATKKAGATKVAILKQAILAYIDFVEKNPTSPFAVKPCFLLSFPIPTLNSIPTLA